MTHLDPATLLTVDSATTFLVGTLFLLSWRQAPGTRALALWGVAHVMGAIGSGGLALRGMIPDILSVGLANAVVLAAFGLVWSGVRTFEGRSSRLDLALAGAAAWMALCLVPAFYGTLAARVVLASAAAGLYCAGSTVEIWRGRAERLPSRLPAAILMALYGGFYLARIPATLLGSPLPVDVPLASPWVAILCLVTMLFSIAAAVTFMALVKERGERQQRVAAGTDPLTGLANRRAFVAEAQAALTGEGPFGLLLFDLDRFKGVNDTYGHAVGDAVLIGFGATAAALLPEATPLGRLGGEEFACLLPDVSPAAAFHQAERLRQAFAGLRVPELPDLQLSVSVGVAHLRGPGDFDALMRRADAALYVAKNSGRDRVEMAPATRSRTPREAYRRRRA